MESRPARVGALCLALLVMSEPLLRMQACAQTEVYQAQAKLFEGNFLNSYSGWQAWPANIGSFKGMAKTNKAGHNQRFDEEGFRSADAL